MKKNTTENENLTKKGKLLNAIGNTIGDDIALKQWRGALQQLSKDGKWFKDQITLIVLIVIGLILYITCRYQAQQEAILEEKLRKEYQDWKFRALTRNSELTLHSRQSQIESALNAFGDSTLKVSTEAHFTIYKKTDSK